MSEKKPLEPAGAVKIFALSTLNYVSFAVALAPLLGSVDVPGLRVLVALMPVQVKDTLTTFSFFLAPLVPPVVRFYFSRRSHRALTKPIGIVLAATLISFVVLVALHWGFVVKVQVKNASHNVAFLVGLRRAEGCCAKNVGNAQCIKEIGTDEAAIESCWDLLWAIEMGFTFSYLVAINGFIVLVGLVGEDRKRESESVKSRIARPDPKPREVFISYAWGDDTPAGKTRAKVAEALYAALAEDGFQPIRDRDQIEPGERISDFIGRLTRADLVVAVISDKYLRSPYCMYEIYRLWQRFQGDGDMLAQCLVPIVLPEVRIGEIEERQPYIEHWDNQAAKAKALSRKLNWRLSPESQKEARLVMEFAHHVDDILVFLKDILMPRKLEAHFDNGFKAVRDALWRRLRDR